MSPSNSSKEEAKAKAADLIRTWCWEKGMEMFADHPLKLLDSEYLRTWGGLKHILFPDGDDLGLKGEIPANHWHYRFYHGVACVLGWTECVTVGDLRYWGEEPHRAIKELWPDRPFPETTSARRSGGLTRW
ncbi:hypothetical protein R1sor_002600 [Riccia sorocarpa]|uniref:Uncharacterized protein n=1 Tax=Riccia sorocarpa TaxID=122646 RepID=A0ABD3H037_9MARC